MRIHLLLAGIALAFSTAPAGADYSSIQHNLFSQTDNVTYDATTRELHIHSVNAGLVTLNDPTALSGTVSNVVFDLVTSLINVGPNGVPAFGGGSVHLSFDWNNGSGVQSYALGGPLDYLMVWPDQVGPSSRLNCMGFWQADLVDLPGSGVWPDGGWRSELNSLQILIHEDLSTFRWDHDTSGRVEALYSLFPDVRCGNNGCFPAVYTLDFTAATGLLQITSAGGNMRTPAFHCVESFAMETHLDSVCADGTAFFSGGSLATILRGDCEGGDEDELAGTVGFIWLNARSYGSALIVASESRWDPTLIDTPLPWPGSDGACGFDGMSHLQLGLVAFEEALPPGFDWTTDLQLGMVGPGVDIWPQECPAMVCTYPFGDLELDCDVDLRDYAAAQRCIAGTASVADKIAGLRVLDADGDLDTDLADFALWQMDGPQNAPQSCCASAILSR